MDENEAKQEMVAACGVLLLHNVICALLAWLILGYTTLSGFWWGTAWFALWCVLAAVLWGPMAIAVSAISGGSSK